MDSLKCPKCGSPLAAGEKFCSACGAPVEGAVRTEDKKSYGKTVAWVVIAAIIVIAGYFLLAPPKPIEAEPSEILAAYLKDAKAADVKYKGKFIKTTGMVSVGDNIPGLPSFVIVLGTEQDEKTGKYAALIVTAEKYRGDTAFMNYAKDHEDGYATVEGKCTGRMDTDVTINGRESCIVEVELDKIHY